MKEFFYTAKLSGERYGGSINAETVEEVRAQLERMSYSDITINDVAVSKAQIQTVKESLRSEAKIADHVASFGKDFAAAPEEKQDWPVPPSRKEIVLAGEKSVIEKANDLLSSKNGIVNKMLMHPDHQGRMHYMLVVEHDA